LSFVIRNSSFMRRFPVTPQALAARALAERLLEEYGLVGWSFRFNGRRTAMGLCDYASRTVQLSWHFVEANPPEAVRDTILHEIAHALTGPGHGHDAAWKAACRRVGAVPRRCGRAAMPVGRWQARCPACRIVYHRHRNPRRLTGWYCRGCGPQGGPLRFGAVPA
jgi:predicted SprT family Zn-dependent metalloprotease